MPPPAADGRARRHRPPTPTAPAASGPAEPELRFFGTVRQGGMAAALVTYPGHGEWHGCEPGDQVGDWQVLSVDGNHLELGLGDERRSFEIFASGARGRCERTGIAGPGTPAPPNAEPADGRSDR